MYIIICKKWGVMLVFMVSGLKVCKEGLLQTAIPLYVWCMFEFVVYCVMLGSEKISVDFLMWLVVCFMN